MRDRKTRDLSWAIYHSTLPNKTRAQYEAMPAHVVDLYEKQAERVQDEMERLGWRTFARRANVAPQT